MLQGGTGYLAAYLIRVAAREKQHMKCHIKALELSDVFLQQNFRQVKKSERSQWNQCRDIEIIFSRDAALV